MSSPDNTAPALPAPLAALGAWPQFILCELKPHPTRIGKTIKQPINPSTGYPHNPLDPAIWMTYTDAAGRLAALGGPAGLGVGVGHMLGFVITPTDPFFFIDIDNALTPTGWSVDALSIAAMVPGAALEVSQSGQGLHILGSYTGERPDHSSAPNTDLGLYTADRFVALTCAHPTGDAAACPPLGTLIAARFAPDASTDGSDDWTTAATPEAHPPATDDELVTRALASGSAFGAFNGRATFADLWHARPEPLGRTWPDAGGREYDASSADGALAGHLAFWTGKNCARIEQIMQRPDCALARDKWERHDGQFGTYLRRTIVGAVARCSAVYGARAIENVATNAPPAPVAGDTSALSFAAAAGGAIAATVANVENALMSAEAGITIAFDEFRARICVRQGERWRLFKNTDYGSLRGSLERRGFKPVSAEVIKTVVEMVAERQRFNSATDRVAALMWDCIPRVATALTRYYGVVDTPYARAASEYLFSALAGRSLSPGCQADMALILVGVQGARKTSAVSALALDFESFGAVNLSHLDDELARKVRGKTVLEWAELRGLTGRDQESIKDWVSRRHEEFRVLYSEFPALYARHFITIGTANGDEILDDPTGERRWLPLYAGQADVEALRADIDQLWAEGAHLYRNGGIRWQEAERLAKEEHHKFKVQDEWTTALAHWLQARPMPSVFHTPTAADPVNGAAPFTLLRCMCEALAVNRDRLTMSDQKRAGKLLKGLGYVKTHTKEGNFWIKGS